MTHLREEVSLRHPALAGHFPGNPIVPGVVILQRVCRAAMQVHGGAIEGVPVVKFHAPLLPGKTFDIEIAPILGRDAGFRVVHENTLIAAGGLRFAPAPDKDRARVAP